MSIILQDQLTLSTKTKEQVEKNTQDIAKNTQDIEDLEHKIAGVYKFKGTVEKYSDLPSTDNVTGDVWDVQEDGMNYAWTDDGTWDQLGPTIDLSGYVQKTTEINGHALSSDITLTAEDVNALPDDTEYQTPINENNKLPAQYIDDNESSKKLVSLTPNIYAPENYGYYDWNDEEQSFTVSPWDDEIIRATYYADRLEGNYVLDFNTYELYTADGDERKAILVAIKTVYSEEDFIRAYIENDKLCLIVKDDSGDWSDPVVSDNTFTQGEKYHIHMEWSEDTPIVSVTMTNRNDNTDIITVESDTQFAYGEYGSYVVFSDNISETEETDEWTYVRTEIILKDAKLSGFEDDRERILWKGMSAFGTGESLSRGLDNFNELGQAKWDSKQDTLISGENIKTINGTSVLGSGDITITTNYSFKAGWTTNSTIAAFLADVYADTDAVPGMSYIGELTCSDLPTGLNNAEAVVEVMPSATAAQKALHVVITSGNLDPYRWELTYWVIGSTPHNSGWIAFQPKLTAGTGIDITNNTISTDALRNTATGTNLTIESSYNTTATNAYGNINVGNNSKIITGESQVQGAIAIGQQAQSSMTNAIALGRLSKANGINSVSIGINAKTEAENAIQIGNGTNSDTSTLQVFNKKLLDANGIIPIARLGATNADTSKFLKGDGTWSNVDAFPAQSGQSGKFLTTDGSAVSWATVDALPAQTGQSGKFLTTNGTTANWAEINTDIALDDIAIAGNNIEFSNIAENFSIHGTPTIEDRVFSDFSANNYLTTSNFLNVNNIESFEVITAFKYIDQTANYLKYKCILEANDGTNKGLRFSLTNEEHRRLFYRIEDATNGLNGLEIRLYGTSEIVSGTKYYSKITYNNIDGYKVYLSDDDGETWTLEAEDSATDLPLQTAGDFAIGQNYAHNIANCFEGEIYLNEWEAYVNENLVWVPYEEVDRTVISSIIPKSYLSNMADDQTSLAILGVATSQVTSGTCVGKNSYTLSGSTAIGAYANGSSTNAVAIGNLSRTYGSNGIAIGYNSQITDSNAIQIGTGTNSDAGTLSIGLGNDSNYQLLNTNGQVPTDRYITMTGADGTTAGTKGVVPAPAATDNNKFLKGDGTWAEAAAQPTYDANTKTITF